MATLNDLQQAIYADNKAVGWWDTPDWFIPGIDGGSIDTLPDDERDLMWIDEVTPTKLALIHSEVSEALEGHRKRLLDAHLPHHSSLAVELADVLIRVLDLSAAHGFDIEEVLGDKLKYNRERQDHTRVMRGAAGGKRY